MVGGEYALMVKSVKYEVSCWLNVDNQKIFYSHQGSLQTMVNFSMLRDSKPLEF